MKITDLLIRFLVGGIVVSIFAMLGDVLRPKTFAGLFGAAPSIALATLGLTILHEGRQFASTEAHSMILGALAFVAYAATTSWVLRSYQLKTLRTTLALVPIWFVVSFGLFRLFGDK